MENWQERTHILVGDEGISKLASSSVAVIGLGGVGAYAAEMLCRAGVGKLLLLDSDRVSITNKNRQLIALNSTVGMKKTEVLAARLKDINPEVELVLVDEYLEEDHVAHLFNANSHDLIFFFTNRGFMYWLNVYEIPEGSRTGKGRAIINLVKMEPGERVCAMLTVTQEELSDPEKYIVMASRTGYIKKTELQLFKNLRRIGLRALVIEEDDDLIGAAISRNGDEILLSTKLGMACRFDQNDDQIRPMGRTARGVTGMRFKLPGDEVVSLEIIREHSYDEPESMTDAEADDMDNLSESLEAEEDLSSTGPEVLVVTTGGMGKRSCVSTYRKTNRGARGVVNIRLRENETVLGVVQITDEDELMMTTERGQLVRIPVSEIRRVGRAAKGVIIMRLNDGDRITGISKVASAEKAQENSDAQQTESAGAATVQESVPQAESSSAEEQTPEQE